MCVACNAGFRIEATDLTIGPNQGRVKAVLHPVSAEFTEALSKNSAGTLVFATGDLNVADVWAHLTAIYISRIIEPDEPGGVEQRDCLFAGLVQGDAIPESPETISVGVVSIDSYLNDRAMANADGGIAYNVDDRQQTLIAKDYVDMAQWGGIPLTAIAEPSMWERERNYKASEYKNLGEALNQLTTIINGPEYLMEHVYSPPGAGANAAGKWASVFRFKDVVGEDRNIILKSDVEGLNCGISLDASNHATRVYAIGAGEEEFQLVSIAHDAASIYPEYHATPAWKDVSVPETLETHAIGHVASFRDPITIPTMSIAGMHPDPSVLRVGDTISAQIIAKSFRFGVKEDGTFDDYDKARILAITWRISVEGVFRVLALQPKIRPALSILAISIIPPEPPTDVEPNPGDSGAEPVGGLVTTIKDSRIQESSGLAHNGSEAVYTTNDEGMSPQVFLIDLATGNTIGEWALSGVSGLSDPESIRLDPVDGSLWVADIGDNDGDRTTKRLVQTAIPSSGAATNFNITYAGGVKVNAEALLIHPITGEKYVATKESVGRLYAFGVTPASTGTLVYQSLPANISDGTFTPDGRFMLFTSVGQAAVFVVDFATGTQVGTIPTDSLPKGESITMEPQGKSFLIGSEGANSPIYRVVLPVEYRPVGGGGGSSPNGLPSGLIDLTNMKLNLPICPYTEIKQPALATYENSSWFYDDGPDVVFRANAGGCTTSGSKYPRSELREMANGGGSNASWNPSSGTHTMTVLLAMSTGTLSAKPHVVGAQVHDASDDVCVFRLEGNSLWLTDGDNPHGTLITSSYVQGTFFEAKFVGSNGSIKAYYNGVLVGTRSAGSGCYFKTGAYVQSNTSQGDASSAYGEVRIRSLVVTHA